MTELIIRALQGHASPAELRELERWRAASPDHEREYQQAARLWRLTGTATLGTGPRAQGRRALDPTDVARRAMDGTTRTSGGARARGPGSRLPHRLFQAAAVIVLVTGVGYLWLARDDGEIREAEVATEAGESTTVHLADGSMVRLAPESRLRFDPAGDGRQVSLEGRAYFAVAPAARAFVVRTAIGEAVVLGTRFDLNVRRDSLTLLVVEGRVALSAAGQRLELGEGQMSVAATDRPSIDLRTVEDVYAHLGWMRGSLLFQATPLRDVIREVERVYDAEVVLSDGALGDRTLTGSFSNTSFDQVMSVICEVLRLTCVIDENRARIAGSMPVAPGSVRVAS